MRRTGVRIRQRSDIPGDVIVDALGRRTPLAVGPSLTRDCSRLRAIELGTALDEHDDLVDAQRRLPRRDGTGVRERYEFAAALDAQRLRMWLGQPVDPTRRDYALFTMAAGAAVAPVDPDVYRVFNRRIGPLDSVAVLDDDIALQWRIEVRFAELRRRPSPPPGPSREEMPAVTTSRR